MEFYCVVHVEDVGTNGSKEGVGINAWKGGHFGIKDVSKP